MLEPLLTAIDTLATVSGLVSLVAGVIIGLLFGAAPGLGGTTALAILLPLSIGMPSADAILLMGGVLGATSFGGSVTAILINTPGTSSNAATCFDGHPLAQQGKAGMAIGAAAAASSLGGIIGVIALISILPLARAIILAFGPPEFFLLAVLGLVAAAVAAQAGIIKGLIAAAFGVLISFVGYDDISGRTRFTGGIDHLWDGIQLVPALIGLFAVAEMMRLSRVGGAIAHRIVELRYATTIDGIVSVVKHWPTLLKGSLIGTFIGIIPGVGGTVASFVSYSVVSQTSRDPASFGRGRIEGVIGPEAANNAKDGGSLVPTLAFGIPGSAETALFLGALILHGLQPGPMLLLEHQGVIIALIMALTLSCIFASLIGVAAAPLLVRLTQIDSSILIPMVLSLSFVGVYSLQHSIEDVLVAAIFGVLGYFMLLVDFPRVSVVIGLVLGSLMERSFHQSLMMSRSGGLIFLERTPSLILLVVIALVLIVPLAVRSVWRPRQS